MRRITRVVGLALAVFAVLASVFQAAPAAAQATDSIQNRAAKNGKVRVALVPVDPSQNAAITKPIMAAAFEDAMLKAGRFVALSRSEMGVVQAEQRFVASGAVDPASAVKLGKALSANYVVVVRQLTLDGRASLDAYAQFLGIGKAKNTYLVSMQAQAIDVETSEIVQSKSFSKKFETSQMVVDAAHKGIPKAGPISEPYRKVVDEFAESFTSELAAAIPLQALVVSIRDVNNIAINAGSEVGLRVGTQFELILEGRPIKDPSGAILGYDNRSIGTAELVRLDAKLSWVKLVQTVSESGTPDATPVLSKVKPYTLVKMIGGAK